MKISKAKDTYDDYKIEQVSFEQLKAIKDALAKLPGATADELRANIEWSLERLPKPGQDEDAAEETEKDTPTAPEVKPAGEKPRAEPTPKEQADDSLDGDLSREFPDLGLPDLPDPDEVEVEDRPATV